MNNLKAKLEEAEREAEEAERELQGTNDKASEVRYFYWMDILKMSIVLYILMETCTTCS